MFEKTAVSRLSRARDRKKQEKKIEMMKRRQVAEGPAARATSRGQGRSRGHAFRVLAESLGCRDSYCAPAFGRRPVRARASPRRRRPSPSDRSWRRRSRRPRTRPTRTSRRRRGTRAARRPARHRGFHIEGVQQHGVQGGLGSAAGPRRCSIHARALWRTCR